MSLTIVMYHYVRDLKRSRMKGLSTERFEGQLDYITRHYRVCGIRDVLADLREVRPLPDNACLLTFDDGFAEHHDIVLPILQRRNLVGSFYAPAEAVARTGVLDVHKIHFALAAVEDPRSLAGEVLELVDALREVYDLPDAEMLQRRHMEPGRFDPPEVVFVKRVLQHGLPRVVRESVVAELFARHVTDDEVAFARKLYMSADQVRDLVDRGMEIGGHGCHHEWLGRLDPAEQAREIAGTRQFLAGVLGHEPRDWVMCYPYGSYNQHTLRLLRDSGCALGLTTRVDVVRDLEEPLQLPRLDTNDLPTSRNADISRWTLEAGTGCARAI